MELRRRLFGFAFNFVAVLGILYGAFYIGDHVRHSQGFHDAMLWIATTFTGGQIAAIAVALYVGLCLGIWAYWVRHAGEDSPEGRRDGATQK